MPDIGTIAYAAGNMRLSGLLHSPASPPRAAVVVFPTIMNHAPNALRRLPMLAEAGCVAMLADLYGQAPQSREEAHRLGNALRADVDGFRAVVATAVRALGEHPASRGLPLVAIGYCMGGQAALEAARMNLPLALVASFHGILSTDRPATAAIRARVLVCHGDKDPLVPRGEVAAFAEEMDCAGADWHLQIHGSARHGFTDPDADSHGIPALGYDASADRQSWAAFLGLLAEVAG